MTAKEFYAMNQEALYRKTLFQGADCRAMVLDWIHDGTITASDLRKHLAGPHKQVWHVAACFLPWLEKQEVDDENIMA